MKIIRRATFNAAHRLFRKDWSDDKNNEVFGLCNNINYHGHNYILEILKEIISKEISDRYDHKNLNLDCPEFFDLNPTVENIALVCYNRLLPHLQSYGRLSIKLFETENNWVEYSGD